MAIQILTSFLEIPDDLIVEKRIAAEIANNTVKTVAKELEQTDKAKLDPNGGRTLVITLTADLDKIITIEKKYIF